MKDMIKIAIGGAYTNFKRILFASDRVTDMELRNAILTGTVEKDKKVDEGACIGCGGCANVCPTGAVTMKALQNPVKLKEGWVKTEVPELDPLKCVVCYWCHDFCPIYSFFEEAGTIHPGNVGEFHRDTAELLSEPIKISQEKISFISQYLSDKSLLSSNVVPDTSGIDNAGVGLEKIAKINEIQDNIKAKSDSDIDKKEERILKNVDNGAVDIKKIKSEDNSVQSGEKTIPEEGSVSEVASGEETIPEEGSVSEVASCEENVSNDELGASVEEEVSVQVDESSIDGDVSGEENVSKDEGGE